MEPWDKLNALHLDALKEIGNIGAGNAATALASMLGSRIQMTVPRAGVLPLKEITALVGNEEDPVACVEFTVGGPAPSKIFFLLDASSAYLLIDLLLGKPAGTTSELDEMGRSVLTELGNILAGTFLNAFADFCRLEFKPSVPAFAFDMLGAVLSSAFLEGGYFSDRALVIETMFYSEVITISGHFFLVPENAALETILLSLGLQIE
ncbi:chemotaxis protein CheC [Neomoorella humiferrea]|uniref:CheY-P phosphatase CheC n=1 Tax=Neomoorella humiferrea TaxID=676965 RepID=A0A2T0AMZ6_9FIRM|nr:chemotaxis protein CheC [Moorella humiferrea]PRR70239.1 CheY-P phosphatase CheC [Moorella humiferrea]